MSIVSNTYFQWHAPFFAFFLPFLFFVRVCVNAKTNKKKQKNVFIAETIKPCLLFIRYFEDTERYSGINIDSSNAATDGRGTVKT